MSQLVTQTTTYGLNSDQYSISTLSSVGGVLEIMAGNPHDEATAPTPIVDFKSDKSAKFYGTVTAPSLSITADNAKVKDKNIVRSINGTVAGEDGNVAITIPSAYVHPNSGVTAGTYNNVTVNAQGHVTAGSNVSVVKTVNNTSPDSNGNVTLNTFITKTGDRGSLAGYETISSSANAITINATSADDQICTGAVTITVSDGSNGQTWQKNVTITNAGATISPGSKWKWAGGKAPELKANSLLVCKWAGVFGVLSLVTTE